MMPTPLHICHVLRPDMRNANRTGVCTQRCQQRENLLAVDLDSYEYGHNHASGVLF